MRPEAFVERYADLAVEIEATFGIPAEIVLGQTALETGWGRSIAANNMFGVKGTGPAGSVNVATKEDYGRGLQGVRDNFRAYNSPQQSFKDYGKMVTRMSRYSDILLDDKLDLNQKVAAMGKSGYATDKNYGSKLAGVIDIIQNTPAFTAARERFAASAAKAAASEHAPKGYGGLSPDERQGVAPIGTVEHLGELPDITPPDYDAALDRITQAEIERAFAENPAAALAAYVAAENFPEGMYGPTLADAIAGTQRQDQIARDAFLADQINNIPSIEDRLTRATAADVPLPGGTDPLNPGAYPTTGPASLSYSPYPASADPMNAGAYPLGMADAMNAGAYPQSGPQSVEYSPYPAADPMNAGAYPSSGPTSITPSPFADWVSPEGRPTLGHNGGPPLDDLPGEYGGKSFSPASEPGFSLPLMAADIYKAPETGFPIDPLDRFGLLPASFTPSTGWAETFPGEYGGKAFTAPQSYPEEQAFSTPYTPSQPDITEALIQFGVDPFAPGAFASPPESYPGEYGGKSFTPSAPYSGPDYGDVGNKSFSPETYTTAGGFGGDGFLTGGGFGGEPGWTNPDGSSMRYSGDSPRERAMMASVAQPYDTAGMHGALAGLNVSDLPDQDMIAQDRALAEVTGRGWTIGQAAQAAQPVGLPSDMSPRPDMSPTARQEANNAVQKAYDDMRAANERLAQEKAIAAKAKTQYSANPAWGLDSPRERLGVGPGGATLASAQKNLATFEAAKARATAQYNAAKAAAAKATTAPAPRAAGPTLSGGMAPMGAAFAAPAVGSYGGVSFDTPVGGGVNYGQLLDYYGGPLGANDPWGNSLPSNVSIDRGYYNQDGSLNYSADTGGGVSYGELMDYYSSDPGTSDPYGSGSGGGGGGGK